MTVRLGFLSRLATIRSIHVDVDAYNPESFLPPVIDRISLAITNPQPALRIWSV